MASKPTKDDTHDEGEGYFKPVEPDKRPPVLLKKASRAPDAPPAVPDGFQPYPAMRYHPNGSTCIVDNVDADEALDPAWSEHPGVTLVPEPEPKPTPHARDEKGAK